MSELIGGRDKEEGLLLFINALDVCDHGNTRSFFIVAVL